MFLVEVESATQTEHGVFIFGKRKGSTEKGKDLYYSDEPDKKYTISGIPIICYKDTSRVLTHTTLILSPGDYNPEDLIGKTLISD